jgi:hypothetical protein
VARQYRKVSAHTLMLVAAVLITVLAASCGSARPGFGPAGGDARLARANCATVSRGLGAVPGRQEVWPKGLGNAADSGIPALDAAIHKLRGALRGKDTATINRAISAVVATCGRLGFWQVYHNGPSQSS